MLITNSLALYLESSPHSPQLEKSLQSNEDSDAKDKQINITRDKEGHYIMIKRSKKKI